MKGERIMYFRVSLADLCLKSHFIALVNVFNFFVLHVYPNMKSKVISITTSVSCKD